MDGINKAGAHMQPLVVCFSSSLLGRMQSAVQVSLRFDMCFWRLWVACTCDRRWVHTARHRVAWSGGCLTVKALDGSPSVCLTDVDVVEIEWI